MDKIDRFLDAIEYPERYTQSEIDAMLQDPEVKEMFDLLDKTKSSLQTIVTPDIEDEWKRFEGKNYDLCKSRMNWLISSFSRNTAASIAIAIASFTAVAALVGVGIHHINNNRDVKAQIIEVVTEPVIVPAQSDTIKYNEGVQVAEIIIFDDEPLETIMDKIASHYGYEVEFNNEASKFLRLYFQWNQENTVEEVVERLDNFEQIHIVIKDKTIKID